MQAVCHGNMGFHPTFSRGIFVNKMWFFLKFMKVHFKHVWNTRVSINFKRERTGTILYRIFLFHGRHTVGKVFTKLDKCVRKNFITNFIFMLILMFSQPVAFLIYESKIFDQNILYKQFNNNVFINRNPRNLFVKRKHVSNVL